MWSDYFGPKRMCMTWSTLHSRYPVLYNMAPIWYWVSPIWSDLVIRVNNYQDRIGQYFLLSNEKSWTNCSFLLVVNTVTRAIFLWYPIYCSENDKSCLPIQSYLMPSLVLIPEDFFTKFGNKKNYSPWAI